MDGRTTNPIVCAVNPKISTQICLRKSTSPPTPLTTTTTAAALLFSARKEDLTGAPERKRRRRILEGKIRTSSELSLLRFLFRVVPASEVYS